MFTGIVPANRFVSPCKFTYYSLTAISVYICSLMISFEVSHQKHAPIKVHTGILDIKW